WPGIDPEDDIARVTLADAALAPSNDEGTAVQASAVVAGDEPIVLGGDGPAATGDRTPASRPRASRGRTGGATTTGTSRAPAPASPAPSTGSAPAAASGGGGAQSGGGGQTATPRPDPVDRVTDATADTV